MICGFWLPSLTYAQVYYPTSGGCAAGSNNAEAENTAFGCTALDGTGTSTGNYDAAFGYASMVSTTSGNYNTASGAQSLHDNSTGGSNTAIGFDAAYESNVSGITAIGFQASKDNSTGIGITAVGYDALVLNTASYNTALGYQALYNNSTGTYNTGEGYQALYNCTTGSYNKANGALALYNLTTGSDNTGIGYSALYSCTTANGNTALGFDALYKDSSGQYNVGLGDSAGYNNTIGNHNTFVGPSANPNAGNYNNSAAFGWDAIVNASNKIVVGNSSIATIGGYQGWTTYPSDGRVKTNIQNHVQGLSFINKLQPITYNIDMDAIDRILGISGRNQNLSPEELIARQQKAQVNYSGFIAQDVEKAAKSVGYDFSGIDVPKNDKDLYGIRYSEFVVPLVKAVQELSKQNDTKDSVIAQQQQQLSTLQTSVDQLNTIVSKLDQALSQCCTSYQSTLGSSSSTGLNSIASNEIPSLNQNVPNPFSENTTITCYVPSGSTNPIIAIYNLEGQELKTFTLANTGINQVVIGGGTLAVGDYLYSLIISGQRIDTKKMTLTK